MLTSDRMSTTYRRNATIAALVHLALFAPSAIQAATLSVTPRSVTLRVGASQTFTVSVWQTTNKAVTWSVNGIPGGNATVGRITSSGVYTAPTLLPTTNPVSVTAASVADSSASASVSVTILHPVPVIYEISPRTVQPGPFAVTITGSGFVAASQVRYGGTVLAATIVSPTSLIAYGQAALLPGGMAALTVTNPDPGSETSNTAVLQISTAAPVVSGIAAVRFLEQTSWGPDPASIARVQQVGFEQYLEQQFAAPASTYPDYPESELGLTRVQHRFFQNALTGPDQLRQRVAFALSQIFVISGHKNFNPAQYVPHLRLLSEHAFGNYGTLLREITLSPAMGRFLDLVVNEKANPITQTAPNENFARELMQLFTIGTEQLNPDGTVRLVDGAPVPTYDEAVVQGTARALTGWTYPTKPGSAPRPRNPAYFTGRLEPSDELHDADEKLLVNGVVVPAGRTTVQDLDTVLTTIYRHPNVAPFVARRLIQHLVTSNPSPAYVARVAHAFNYGGAARGDMKAVIRAILLDSEARQGDLSPFVRPLEGHLREPVLYFLGMMRATGSRLDNPARLPGLLASAGQALFYAPSVFNYFSATYTIPGTTARGPEFEIFTPSAAVFRTNLAMLLTFMPHTAGIEFDLTPFDQFAGDPPALVEAANRALLGGRLGAVERQRIEAAVSAISSTTSSIRAQTALYLVASSPQYQVQH